MPQTLPGDKPHEQTRKINGEGQAWHERNLRPIEVTQIYFRSYEEARSEWRKFLRGEPGVIGWWD